MSDQLIKYVEQRLSEWAEWFLQGNFYGLGYPKCSMEYRLMTEGVISRNQYANRTVSSNKEAEEMEMLDCFLHY